MENTKEQSEKWLREFCQKQDFSPEYESILNSAEYYSGGDSLHCGDVIYGEIPDEFWDHVEVVTGKNYPERATYFKCSC